MNILTFDIEERFHSHLSRRDVPRKWVTPNYVETILEFLNTHQLNATFFVLGEYAEKYPNLINQISQNGYEIGSHGYDHSYLDNSPRILDSILKSKNILEDITGRHVKGFRAPSWSANFSDKWLWEFLAGAGFVYDSSLFPFKSPLYGSNKNQVTPFKFENGLIEIPPSVYEMYGIRIPFGGGFYYRLYPLWMTKLLSKRHQRRGNDTVFYFHPWEFGQENWHSEDSLMFRFIANVNIHSNWKKFTHHFQDMETVSMIDYVMLNHQGYRNYEK